MKQRLFIGLILILGLLEKHFLVKNIYCVYRFMKKKSLILFYPLMTKFQKQFLVLKNKRHILKINGKILCVYYEVQTVGM